MHTYNHAWLPDEYMSNVHFPLKGRKVSDWERIEEWNIIKCPKSTPKWILLSVCLYFNGLCEYWISMERYASNWNIFTFHSEMWHISEHSFDFAFAVTWTSYSDWIAWMNHGVHLIFHRFAKGSRQIPLVMCSLVWSSSDGHVFTLFTLRVMALM